MKNKILIALYYFLSFIVTINLIYFFLLKIMPTFYHYFSASLFIQIFDSVLIAGFFIAAADFVYRKIQPRNLLGPFMLILGILIAIELSIFNLKYLFSLFIAVAALYIISKTNKSILRKIYSYTSLFLWISVITLTVYNYVQAMPYRLYLHTFLLIIFLLAMLRSYLILRSIIGFYKK